MILSLNTTGGGFKVWVFKYVFFLQFSKLSVVDFRVVVGTIICLHDNNKIAFDNATTTSTSTTTTTTTSVGGDETTIFRPLQLATRKAIGGYKN